MIEIILTCTLMVGQTFTLPPGWTFESVSVENVTDYFYSGNILVNPGGHMVVEPGKRPGPTKIVLSRKVKTKDAWNFSMPKACGAGDVEGRESKRE